MTPAKCTDFKQLLQRLGHYVKPLSKHAKIKKKHSNVQICESFYSRAVSCELHNDALQGKVHVCHLDVAMYNTETVNVRESLKQLLNLEHKLHPTNAILNPLQRPGVL